MAVSIDRARQFYMENRDKFPGMNMTDAVASIVRSGTLPFAAAPAAAPEQGLAQVANAPVPTPTQVTPPPAPQQAPAPAPAPEYQNPYDLQLAAFRAANPETPAAPQKKGPVDYAAQARADIVNAERRVLERDAAVAKGAKIDPEVEKVLEDRDTRFEAQIADIDKDRQQAIWMAIAQAGMKMAQSQSPYFLQALASGMEAGLNGYSEDKAKAAEKKARLQDAKEEIALKKYELRTAAIDKAVAQGRAVRQDIATEQGLTKGALANLLGIETIDEAIAGAGLENQLKSAQIANTYDAIRARREAGARAEAAARSGGSGGINTKNAGAFVNSLVSENKTHAAILTDPLATPAQKAQAQARINDNQRKIDYVRSLQSQKLGMGSGFKILGPG